jgi:membrane protease YdiL (CAAX protease family)
MGAREFGAPFRWTRRDLIAFVSFFIATVIFLPLLAFLVLRVFDPALQMENFSNTQKVLIQATMDTLWIAFILFLVKGRHHQPIFRTLRFVRAENASPIKFALAGFLMALISILLSSVLFPAPSPSGIEKLPNAASSLVLVLVFGSLMGPVLEEIVFRGFVFKVVEDVYAASLAVPVTTVLFAGLHLSQLGSNWPAFLVILVVGYLLTLVRQKTGSIIPSIIMHTTYNATILGIAAFAWMLTPGAKR